MIKIKIEKRLNDNKAPFWVSTDLSGSSWSGHGATSFDHAKQIIVEYLNSIEEIPDCSCGAFAYFSCSCCPHCAAPDANCCCCPTCGSEG